MIKDDSKYSISFDKQGRYVYIELKGVLRGNEVVEASSMIIRSDSFVDGLPQIWQISETDLSNVDDDTVRSVSQTLIDLWLPYIKAEVAIISTKLINQSLILLFQEHYDQDNGKVKVFSNLQSAMKWLNLAD